MSKESLVSCSKHLKQYAPHKPLWTAIGVAALAEEEMQIEVVVKAKSQWWFPWLESYELRTWWPTQVAIEICIITH